MRVTLSPHGPKKPSFFEHLGRGAGKSPFMLHCTDRRFCAARAKTASTQPKWRCCGFNSFGKVPMGLLTHELQGVDFVPSLGSMLGE
jgi:hypothetical protein